MKTITILSGKGGVGKSTIAASLAVLLSRKEKIVVADCDVDAANFALLLGMENFEESNEISTNFKAFAKKESKECKEIVENCAFSAISWDKEKNMPKINRFLCEGCGVCKLLCPRGITMKKVINAIVGKSMTKYGFPLVCGQLKMGESGSGNIVNVVKKEAEKIAAEQKAAYLIIDSAPGIGCPVIASIKGSDYVLAITEPTPTAFRSLARVLRVVEHFGISFGIVINKWDLNKEFIVKIREFAEEKKAKIVAEIPYSRDFIKAIVEMKPIIESGQKYEKIFEKIESKIK